MVAKKEEELKRVIKAEKLGRGVRVAPTTECVAMALPDCGTLD